MSHCACEKELKQQSSHSPCLVSSDEMIVYALTDPLTIVSGSVKEISKRKLKEATLSVCRADYCTGPEAKAAIVDALLAGDSSRIDCGFYVAECEEIRSVSFPNAERAFCVLDDGLPDYSAHAVLANSDPLDVKNMRNFREATRANLLRVFQIRGQHTVWAGPPFME